ncbi:MAG: hypothetical protein KJT03_15130, partial [Verrucomicrobiae bacterium]|nr:hypothetical protein [Verrucomicrobiae bacterium]
GTFLAENYPYNSNGLLFSPPIFIPQNGLPQFTYHEWYATATSAHYGQVQIRRVGEEWSDVANTRVFGSGTTWAEKILDLTPYAGDTIQIGFRFVSNNFGTPLAGWFLDAVSLDIPLYTSIAPIDTVSIPIIPISWMGGSTDGLITGFDVYVRTDDGDWALWLEDTLQTSGVWIGEANRRYRFYVAARDSSGASIAPPEAGTTAQADTFVILPVRLTNVAHSTNASVSTVSFDLTGGTPGDAWNIRRASTMKGPWTNAGIVILDDNGNGQFADNNAPAPDIFYDAIKPD